MRFGLIALVMTVFLLAACADKDKLPTTPSPGTSAAPAVGPSASIRPGTTPAGSDGIGGIILNEVRFAAVPGAPAFVELKNTNAARSSPSGLGLKGSTTFPVPADAPEMESGGVLVITFDGDDATSGNVLHALDSAFPGAGTGTLSLINGNTEWDRVSWSDGSLAPGGAIDEPPPGSVAARVPAGGESGSPWALLGPSQATPGTPNPAPAVSAFATPDGSVFQTSARLAWYSVPGATSYRVELSANSSFDPLLADETVTATRPGALTPESVSVEALAPGLYQWRVTAVYPSGEAVVSAVQRVGVSAGDRASAARATPVYSSGAGAVSAIEWGGVHMGGDASAAQATPEKRLEVPQINQRKDTAMLQLENPSESGPLAWDKPDADQPLRPYCVYAAVAMLNRFFGGDWSVDYAHYVTLKDQAPGPELDLQERGAILREERTAIHKALGVDPGEPRYVDSSADLPSFYATIKAEIDDGRPLAARWPGHSLLIIGYADQDEFGNFSIVVQDGNGPAWARSEFPDSSNNWGAYFTIPPGAVGARQPAGVIGDSDSDRDGVVDFDETDRFGLSSGARDSDADGLDDKQDIRAGTWDERHGYARGGPGRDIDRDRVPMERDPDADDGGCFDGMEDANGNGKFDAALEIDNFERGDDPCIGGTYLHVHEQVTSDESGSTRSLQNSRALIALQPEVDGRLTGRAIVTYFLELQSTYTDCSIEVPRVTTTGVSTLTGELVAGKLQIEAEPEKGPPFSAMAVGCGISDSIDFEGTVWFAGWGLIEFADGRYDYRADVALPEGVTGEVYIEVHLRQPGS